MSWIDIKGGPGLHPGAPRVLFPHPSLVVSKMMNLRRVPKTNRVAKSPAAEKAIRRLRIKPYPREPNPRKPKPREPNLRELNNAILCNILLALISTAVRTGWHSPRQGYFRFSSHNGCPPMNIDTTFCAVDHDDVIQDLVRNCNIPAALLYNPEMRSYLEE